MNPDEIKDGIMKECVGCHLDWCAEQPALDLVQFIIGVVILTLGHPFRIALTQSIYSKMLGPIPQVKSLLLLFVFFVLYFASFTTK